MLRFRQSTAAISQLYHAYQGDCDIYSQEIPRRALLLCAHMDQRWFTSHLFKLAGFLPL